MAFIIVFAGETTIAHPLGNFTINHFARIEVGTERIGLRYVVDMAEIAAFQELRAAGAYTSTHTGTAAAHIYIHTYTMTRPRRTLTRITASLVSARAR